MPKRFHDTDIWNQDWFWELPFEYATLWFFVKDDCDHAGIWKPNKKRVELFTKKEISLTEALEHFNKDKDRVRVLKNGRWFLEDFIPFQYGNHLNANSPMHRSIIGVLAENEVKLRSIRGLKGLSPSLKDKERDKDKGSETPKEQDKDKDKAKDKDSLAPATASSILDYWNLHAPKPCPRATLTESRKAKAKVRISENPTMEFWGAVIQRISLSKFLMGQEENKNGRKPWVVTFDWILENDKNALKIFEGNYDDKQIYVPRQSVNPAPASPESVIEVTCPGCQKQWKKLVSEKSDYCKDCPEPDRAKELTA